MAKNKNQKSEKTVKISRKAVKEEIQKTQSALMDKIDDLDAQKSFATRVLDRSNSVITYFTPVVNNSGKIEDFTVAYFNDRMQAETEEPSNKSLGKKMSEYNPTNLENGVFEELVLCWEQDEDRDFQKRYVFGDSELWFSSRVTKLDDGVIVFSKNITKEKEYEIELDVQNKLLSEAEYVANIGSYKWKLDEEVIHYSDNAYRLFGYEPGEFEATVESFMTLVHPDDLQMLTDGYDAIIERKERTESKYRIITKDDKIKTIRSIGEFYEKEGQWHMVGVLADVTEQVATEVRLKNRNQELKRTNDELESFNRIASHDLQEPLRKIQMFISRLDEEASEKLDERAKKYFTKVTSSVERMRELISNLLSYSRIEGVEETPDKVDLNEVLENVREDLAERISELDATIHVDSLPSVTGIEFQLEQLFSNLIGNALKYKKPDTAPIIAISSQILAYSKIEESLALPRSRYLELRFTDNGIGFGPEHQEKIFEIFQRLHSKNDYSGTGLGLAICRKIVQSHHGAITAKGIAGEGATFTVYLPYSA